MKELKILIACEESQTVCKAFRELGFIAYSCDLVDCSGGHPEWHIKGDAIKEAYTGKYDLMVAHPPCTFLSVSGARWLYNKDGSKNIERWENRRRALDFVKKLMDAPIKHIAIENPVSVISSQIRKPDQIVQPFWFGDEARKTTCLWLKNLPKLQKTKEVSKGEIYPSGYPKWMDKEMDSNNLNKRRKARSKTFPGIAKAIADQWGNYILEKEQ